MAEQPLLMTEIESYCRVFGFQEDAEFFFQVMFTLDAEYMKYVAEQREQQKAENPEPKPGMMSRFFRRK